MNRFITQRLFPFHQQTGHLFHHHHILPVLVWVIQTLVFYSTSLKHWLITINIVKDYSTLQQVKLFSLRCTRFYKPLATDLSVCISHSASPSSCWPSSSSAWLRLPSRRAKSVSLWKPTRCSSMWLPPSSGQPKFCSSPSPTASSK